MRSLIAAAALVAATVGLVGHAQAQDFDLMQFADGDSDGKVTVAEYTSFSEQTWGFVSQGGDKVKVADLDDMAKGALNGIAPDADGAITKVAYIAGVPDRFKSADKNGDGVLDSAELNATMRPPS